MIPKGLFTQLAMIALSVGIITTHVQPSFAEIGKVQDSISTYSDKRKEVSGVNQRLNTLVDRLDSVSQTDKVNLNTYMPDNVDTIGVPRDLLFIVLESGVLYKSVDFAGDKDKRSSNSNSGENGPKAYTFSLSIEGTYSQLKNFFKLIERNNYPLEIENLSIQLIDGGFLSASMDIVTYSYQKPEVNGRIVF
ncbi:hypothetical protein KC926_00725 [Candidatus Kaiserbacteria bacterium]|nr:hypothetical protein [Candidatus Kaiserbacteria bacterium]